MGNHTLLATWRPQAPVSEPDRLSDFPLLHRYAWGRVIFRIGRRCKQVQKSHESREKTPWTDAELKALVEPTTFGFSNLLPVECFGAFEIGV